MSSQQNAYATSAAIRRVLCAVQKAGASISMVRVLPGGAIEVGTAGAFAADELSDFDRLDAEGRL